MVLFRFFQPPGGPSGGIGISSLPTAPTITASTYPRLYGENTRSASADAANGDDSAKLISKEKSELSGPPPSYDSLPSDSVPVSILKVFFFLV